MLEKYWKFKECGRHFCDNLSQLHDSNNGKEFGHWSASCLLRGERGIKVRVNIFFANRAYVKGACKLKLEGSSTSH